MFLSLKESGGTIGGALPPVKITVSRCCVRNPMEGGALRASAKRREAGSPPISSKPGADEAAPSTKMGCISVVPHNEAIQNALSPRAGFIRVSTMTSCLRHATYAAFCPAFTAVAVCVASVALCTGCAADTPPAPETARAANAAQVERMFEQNRRQYGTNANYLVRLGLLADRVRKEIRISAESVKLNASDPVEFPLIARNSGKDYEALAVSFPNPSDIHDALVFIGMTPGHPVDAAACRFWPKGERVRMTFAYRDAGNTQRVVRAERLVIDTRTGKTLPEDGFVFVGSSRIPAADSNTSATVYAADVYTPNAVAAVYNEPTTVLDVPRRATQTDVYSFQVPNPGLPLPNGQVIEVVLKPEGSNTAERIRDCVLRVEPDPATPGEATLALTDSRGMPINTNLTTGGLSTTLDSLVAAGQDPYVTIIPGDLLSLSTLARVCGLIDNLENERGMRVEPPPRGHPFYKSFLPNERFRSRKERPIQPIELNLAGGTSSPTGTVTFITEEWAPETDTSIYHETNFPAASPLELDGLLGRKDAPSVLLVFAPPDLTYGALRSFVTPALNRRLILYVFLPKR